MSQVISSDQLRVTSVPYLTSKHTIFTGIPLKLNSYKINNGKYYITIKAGTSTLPVVPAIGQHWAVSGKRIVETMEVGDYVMQQHTYDAPDKVSCTLPEDGEQLIKFIAKEKDFKGIGESKARALWQLLGTSFYPVVSHDTPKNRKKLEKVLHADAVDALFEGYAKYRNLSACNWMSTHKIPAQVQQRLLKYHDEQSLKAIKSNPYVLLGFGMSFGDVDALAQTKLNVEKDDLNRLLGAVEMAIRKEIEKGHTYTTQAAIRPTVKKLLGSNELATLSLIQGHKKAQFILNSNTGTYHPTAQLLMELVVAKRLKKLASKQNLYDEAANEAYLKAIQDLPYELTDKQIEAIIATLDNGMSCITGGAGTGKTTVLRTVLKAFVYMNYTIHAVTLSGRAAMRLHESIGFNTMTIAALLRHAPIETNTEQPKHLLVIDEASMIDLPTMYRLVTHISPQVRILLTGDPDQLPPIGCGKVLADIVDSKAMTNTMLDIVKRQEGSTGIPEYSKLVNSGIVPDKLTTGAITFHQTPKDQIARRCTELFIASRDNSRIMGSTRAMVAEINRLTQDTVNPYGQRLEFEMYGEKLYRDLRLGDAILFTRNNYDKGIQNGSLGKLISVDPIGDTYGIVALDTGDIIEITQAVLDCMELGYCITLHKAQGSQFPRVIIALQKGRIVDRAWLYTAITRAETEIHIVGSVNDFKQITEALSHTRKRNSFLVQLLSDR